jgi:hypothetical protein
MIVVTPEVKRQLYFWLVMLKARDGMASIPDPSDRLPAWTVEFYTDAAGGSTSSVGNGTGGLGRGAGSSSPGPPR